MKILLIPSKTLLRRARPVRRIDKRIDKLAEQMLKTLESQKNPEGVGLAAPQVGVSLQLFVIKSDSKKTARVFINPKIVKIESKAKNKKSGSRKSGGKRKKSKAKLEGCLSIPHIWGKVRRHQKITVKYQDLSGTARIETLDGFEATIVQHEIDHLQGTLFTKRVLEQGNKLYEDVHGELEEYEI